MLSNLSSLRCLQLTLAITCATLTVPARAVEFEIEFNAATGTHSADPQGELLSQLVTAAAARWSDVIEDSHTLTLDVGYADIGQICPDDAGVRDVACFQITEINESRATRASLYFSESSNWYFDATPESDEEFAFETTLFKDLVPPAFPFGTQFDHFNGFGFEPVLEVGCGGDGCGAFARRYERSVNGRHARNRIRVGHDAAPARFAC